MRKCVPLSIVLCGMSSAQPVEYSFQGVGTGEFNGVNFVDTEFEIVLPGDLSDRTTTARGYPEFRAYETARLSIAGLVVDDVFRRGIVLEMNTTNGNLRLRSDNFPTQGRTMFALNESDFAGYELTAPFGPVVDESVDSTTFVDIPMLNGGFVSIGEISAVRFEARLVPTPAACITVGFAGVIASRRRR